MILRRVEEYNTLIDVLYFYATVLAETTFVRKYSHQTVSVCFAGSGQSGLLLESSLASAMLLGYFTRSRSMTNISGFLFLN
jgi:hypothetical protein